MELLVAVGIIGLLIAILLPAVQAARESARRVHCKNNLRQIALSVHRHVDDFRTYPRSRFFGTYGVGPDATTWSWLATLLPYLEQQQLFDEGNVPRSTLRQSGIAHQQVSVFLCPSDGYSAQGARRDAGNLEGFAVGQTNYQGVSGSNWGHDQSQGLTEIGTDWANQGANGSWDGQDHGDGMLFRTDYRRRRTPAIVRDGLSQTLMIGENLPERNGWCSWPYANNSYGTAAIPLNVQPAPGSDYHPLWWPNVAGFRSRHPGGGHFAMADGSVTFIKSNIELAIYRALATIQGGEVVYYD